jgi:hypothetical protein
VRGIGISKKMRIKKGEERENEPEKEEGRRGREGIIWSKGED